MAFVLQNRNQETTTTTGTGTITLAGAVAGFQSFATVGNGNTTYYCITSGSAWEVGLGTYSSAGPTLARTTIYSNSLGTTAAISLTGTSNVFVTLPAEQILGNGKFLQWQSVQTSDFTAVSGYAYPVNTTSAAITVPLPASPSIGDLVAIVDYAGTWATNTAVFNPNGNKINGSATNAILATNRESVALVYIDSTQGWIPYSGFNTSTPIQSITATYLILAGGGGGGANDGGGGGAGGLLTGTTTLATGTTYSFVVGAGGAGSTGTTSPNSGGSNGSNSTGFSLTAIGGGGGGGQGSVVGQGGGSGGGGSNSAGAGAGTSGQGFAGGTGLNSGNFPGGGGGGAGAVGGNAPSASTGGSGGAGASSSITGSAIFYGGGGGAAVITGGTAGTGGSGGGGNGGVMGAGTNGTANLGGGGGGTGGTATGNSGGSGVVILSILTAYYTGTVTGSPTVTTSGASTIIKFTASGSYTA